MGRYFKEARQLGENTANEEKLAMNRDPTYEPNGLKRTQVLVVPYCENFDSFEAFENVIQATNQARINALDWMTDLDVEKFEKKIGGVGIDAEWR
jgi:hypothetical protein